MRRADSLEKTLILGKIEGEEKGNDRGWDGWMASLTQWTWVWVNSGSWWWTGRPGELQSMGSQKARHDWVTELELKGALHLSVAFAWKTCCCCLVTKPCPTLGDPMDCNPPASSVHGIFQAIIWDWVAISFSRRSSWPRDWTLVSWINRRILIIELYLGIS